MTTVQMPMMALQPQISLPQVVCPVFCPWPWQAPGKPSYPSPLPKTLGSTCMFAHPFIPLCGPESPQTHSRRLLLPFPTERLAWLLTDMFPCGLWERDTGNQYHGYSGRGELPLRHLWGQPRAQHRKAVSPRPEGTQGTHCFSGALQPSSVQGTRMP